MRWARDKDGKPIAAVRVEDAYECLRCSAIFANPKGPEPFCESCRKVLEERRTAKAQR